MTRLYSISPVDAWYFGDSGPYNMNDTSQSNSKSLFPPNALTVVGAMRAGLAKARGWDGRSNWNDEKNQALGLVEILGDGFDDLGKLQFHGPYLKHDGELLFPLPLHVLGKAPESTENWQPLVLLKPSAPKTAVVCDLGENIRLPVADTSEKGLKDGSGYWITAQGMAKLLHGELPDGNELRNPSALWAVESRVGLMRNADTRSAEEGALYSPSYIRLQNKVAVVEGVGGLPDTWSHPEQLATFGGEGRLASIELRKSFALPAAPIDAIMTTKRLAITFLTPALIPESLSSKKGPLPGSQLPDVPFGTIVSGVVGKPVAIGGWDSTKRKPIAQKSFIAPGSTYFIEISDTATDDLRTQLLALHGSFIGERTRYGFGQVVLGVW